MNAVVSIVQPVDTVPDPVTPEDAARAAFYGLIARLFVAPADAELLRALGTSADAASDGNAEFPVAWRGLCGAASVCEPDLVAEEFETLFVGVGKPEILPYASSYLAGFMNEKPLAQLRADLADLGLARHADVKETEDHMAAICESMRHLVLDESLTQAEREARQRAFFVRHVAPWYAALCNAIEAHPAADFFRTVARFVRAFLDLDRQAFEIEI